MPSAEVCLSSATASAAVASKKRETLVKEVLPMTEVFAQPPFQPNATAAPTPTSPPSDPMAKPVSYSLAASRLGGKSGSLPIKFRFDMTETVVPSGSNLAGAAGHEGMFAITPRSNLADAAGHEVRVGVTSPKEDCTVSKPAAEPAHVPAEPPAQPPHQQEAARLPVSGVPPLPESATAEEEAARRERELPPLPPSPGQVGGSPAMQSTLDSEIVTASEQLPQTRSPLHCGRRSSSSIKGSRWGAPLVQGAEAPTPACTQIATSAAASSASRQNTAAASVQLHAQLPTANTDQSRTAHPLFPSWGAPPSQPQPPPPTRPIQNAPLSHGIPTDPRRQPRGISGPSAREPPPRGHPTAPSAAAQDSSTSALLRPGPPPARRASPGPLPPLSRPPHPLTGHISRSHDGSFRQVICPKDPPPPPPQADPTALSSSHTPSLAPAAAPQQLSNPQQRSDAGSGSWYVANPAASDMCRSSSVSLKYTWGQSSVSDSLELTARVWCTARMGRSVADSGVPHTAAQTDLVPMDTKTQKNTTRVDKAGKHG